MGQRSELLSERLSQFSPLLTNSKQNTDKFANNNNKMVKETDLKDLTPFFIFPFHGL
jgi:hypothetical protein